MNTKQTIEIEVPDIPSDCRVISNGKCKLFYSPCTGEFLRQFKSGKVNRNIGHINYKGYRQISFSSKTVTAHRLAFVMMGLKAPDQVDHINGDRLDNRWANLRGCDNSLNQANTGTRADNKTGVKGVSLHKPTGMFRGKVSANKVSHQKYFKDFEDAALWVKQKREELHKEFANHG